MLGNPHPDRFDLVAVGGGIAGLVAGATAAQAGRTVAVLDAREAPGRAATVQLDGFALNPGPHALYLQGALRAALGRLGIDPPGASPAASALHVLRDGHVWRFPTGPLSLARTALLGRRSRVRAARLLGGLAKLHAPAGTSVEQWLADEPDDLAALVRMLVRTATYTDAPDRLDAGAATAQLRLAAGGVRYVDGGWRTIVAELRSVIEAAGGTIRTDTAVSAVGVDPDPFVIAGERTWPARAVVIAAGGPDAVEHLVGRRVPGRADLGPAVEASCLDLGTNRAADPSVLFGVDVPWYLSTHGPVAAGLAPAGRWLLQLLEYLPPGAGPAEPDVMRDRFAELAAHAGIGGDDVVMRRYLHRMTVMGGMPLAATGGLAARPAVDALHRDGLPGVFLAGDWVGGEGMLADASAASASRAVALAAGLAPAELVA
jgi:phytoene dehydrogenase-like protein